MEEDQESLKYLFQQEFSKMVAVISGLYGLQHIEIAEDIVSETFLQAAETWGIKGLPANPTAWLYVVAKQKTLYYFRRNKILKNKVLPELTPKSEDSEEIEEPNFSEENIKDNQLRMLFAICNPAIVSEAQIGLALRILCGFGIDEIADAFLTNKETVNKRLFRAKEKLRAEKIKMELPPEGEISERLDNVLHIIYLLFTEGYYSKTQDSILRKDLCLEALRLGVMLSEYEKTDLPKTNALLALMCFHASRFHARQTEENSMILYEEQDEGLWDTDLIRQGVYFLDRSAKGKELSSYHLEARIAYWHCRKEDSPEKWADILDLYNRLLLVNYSPSVALNRLFALYKAKGKEAALLEAEELRLENNHFYYLLLGELYKDLDEAKARANLEIAYSLAKTQTERQGIQEKLFLLNPNGKKNRK
ncbi:sigma-70 family RNA polymerase sigma factor [Leptospira semungkisensis]|uniref:Sigma-70 family RNA polymerase sigma factor n=1 Tax=Leptospira semungkisensis TaxID=2484985 RepID=A0A4R9FLG2_9LEPT|nr:sigma-70 family RNA polymerase sigma factor [Leptospira semungkisensis]TGJ99501.1 sigma-70 family RNA polymerase sigma factor [Leptospira semungkisensis]